MLKSFSEYISEGNRVDGVYGGTGENKGTDLEQWEAEQEKKKKKKKKPEQDEKLEAEVQKEIKKDADKCPRCGKVWVDCKCQEKDYQSTVNVYRQEKGKVTKY